MKRKMISVLLCLCMVLSLLPVSALAADEPSGGEAASTETQDASDQSTYDELGLKTNASSEDTLSPYGESTNQLMTGSEVYLAANGEYGNCYTLRSGMDRVGGGYYDKYNGHNHDDFFKDNANNNKEGCGFLYGGYEFYNISRGFHKNKISARDSMLSDNSSTVLANQSDEWCGLYATSTAFNATVGKAATSENAATAADAKDNYVAELQVNGDENNTYVKAEKSGAAYDVNLVTYSIDAGGKRNEVKRVEVSNAAWVTERRSTQEFDDLFEVKAGDIDGDGMDELAVYCGKNKNVNGTRYALVDIYEGDTLALKQTLALNAGSAGGYLSYKYHASFYTRPAVTLAMGDLNRDLYEDLAAVVTMPAGCNSYGESAAYLFQSGMQGGEQGNQVRELPAAPTQTLALQGDGYSMVAGNCTFGTTTLPGSSAAGTVLLVGGYAAGDKDSCHFSKGLYATMYYDYDTGKYIASAVKSVDLSDRTLLLTKYQIDDSNSSSNPYGSFYAPLALAFADMDGVSGATPDDDLLFGATVYSFDMNKGFGNARGNISLSMAQPNVNGDSKPKEQIWIGDVAVGCVTNGNSTGNGGAGTKDGKTTSATWADSILYVVGTYTKSSDADDDSHGDYNGMDLGGFWRTSDGRYLGAQEGVISDGNSTNQSYGSYISLCLPDVDNDSVVMRFKGKSLTYTVPEVYAVLQASPYFSDLQQAYDYIGNGGTSYSTAHSSGATEGTSLSIQAGVYSNAESSIGFASELEFEADVGVSYEFAAGQETGYDITYNNQAGDDDAVVVYTVPMMYYAYDVYDPVANTWGTTTLSTTMKPVTAVLGVTEYDEIAEKTSGLDPIRGSLLYSTPGEPSSYVNAPAGDREYAYNGNGDSKTNYSLATAGTAADQTQEISHTSTKENSFEIYTEISEKVGLGAGLFGTGGKAGVTSNQHIGVTAGWSSSKETDYSGTVDNLPKDAAGYSFSWRLIVNTAKLNGNKIWLVGYDVQGVSEPPKMPQNLRVEGVTANSVTLSWEQSNNAQYYNVYAVDSAGAYNYLDAVPASSKGTLSKTLSDLESNRSYQFAVQAVSSVSGSSIFSPTVSAQTLTKGGFTIDASPKDQTVNVNDPVSFTAKGVYASGGQTVRYQWQSRTGKAGWKDISGATGATYAIDKAAKSQDGTQFRCRAYCLDSSLYTAPATLTVNLLKSTVALNGVTENSIYNASGYKTETKSVTANTSIPIVEEKEVTDESGVKYAIACTLTYCAGGSGSNNWLWQGSDGSYYNYTGTVPTLKNNIVTNADSLGTANVGAAIELGTLYFANTGDVDNLVALNEPTDGADATYTITKNNIPTDYKVSQKWTAKTGGTIYRKLQCDITDKNGTTTKTIYVYGTDNTEFQLTTHATANGTDVSTLSTAKKSVAANTNYVEYTPIAGEKLTLTAAPKSGSTAITGGVTFVITGASGTTLKAEQDGGQYTATWTPPAAGKYTVTAVYAGTSTYAASRSDPVTFYAALQDSDVLSLTLPANTTYNQSVDLAATKTSGKKNGAEATSSDVTTNSGTTYTVQKLVAATDNGITTYTYTDAAADADYKLADGRFTPLLATNFLITAKNGDLTATAVTAAGKATLTITADNISSTVETEDRPAMTIKTEPDQTLTVGTESGDSTSDVILTSSGPTAAAPGSYPITAALNDTDKNENVVTRTNTVSGLLEKYNIILKSGIYTLSTQTYPLTLTAGANGSASVDYVYGGQTIHAAAVNGAYAIPSGAKVTVTAAPNTGYGVKQWTVNTAPAGAADSYTINSMTAAESVSVDFALTQAKMSFSAAKASESQGSTGGSVTGAYVSNIGTGSTFTSGGSVFYDSHIRLTATPDDGMTVDHWTVKTGDGDAKIIKAADGTTNFSGAYYDFTGLSETTAVTVYFKAKESVPVTVKLVDKNGTPLSSSGVTVTSDKTGSTTLTATSGTYTYEGSTGENLSLDVTIPDNMLVQNWSVGNDQITGSLSNGSKTMTVYNLSKSTDFTVVCAAPNEYSVSFGGELTDGTFSSDVGTVTAEQINGGALHSGSTLVEGAAVAFTATPQKGYVLTGWEVNGKPTEKADLSWTLNSLSDNMTVTAVFKKLSSVKVDFSVYAKSGTNAGYDGTLSAQAVRGTDAAYTQASGTPENANVTSGSFASVYEGSTVTFTAKPADGYRVAWWRVNNAEQGNTSNSLTLNVDSTSKDTSVVVKYELIGDKINFSCGTHGTLSAKMPTGADFASGNTVNTKMDLSFTAVPDAGYEISGWTLDGKAVTNADGSALTDTAYTYSADGMTGVTIHVDFKRCAYAVSYAGGANGSVTATKNGTTIGASPVKNVAGDTDVTFTAKADEGYHFTGWTVTEGGKPVAIDGGLDHFDRPITADLSVTASFALSEKNYTVSYSVSDPSNGSITATSADKAFDTGTSLKQQSTVTFTAVPADGWQVKEWQVNNKAVANTREQSSFTIDSLLKNVTVQAVLEKIPSYTVTVTSDFGKGDKGSGTVTATVNGKAETLTGGTLTVPQHAKVVLTATPAAGNLPSWTTPDGGTIGGETAAPTLSFSDVTRSIACTASFTVAQEIEVKASVQGGGGSITNVVATDTNNKQSDINGAYTDGVKTTAGQTLTFTAVPEKNEMLEGWYIKDAPAKTSSNSFELLGAKLTARLLGTAPEGYTKLDELGNTLTLKDVGSDVDVVAKFTSEKEYTFEIADSNTGTTFTKTPVWGADSAKTIRDGGTVTFTVKPNDGYLVDDVAVSTNTFSKKENADYSWTVTVSNVTSNFIVTPSTVAACTVAFTAGTGGSISAKAGNEKIASGARVKTGTSVVFTAAPSANYSIGAWTVTPAGTASADKKTYTINLTENTVASVSFTANGENPGGGGGGGGETENPTLSFESNGGSAIESFSKAADSVIELSAYVPTRDGYVFSGWYSDRALHSAVTSVTLSADTTVYAKWTPAAVDTLLNAKEHIAYLSGYEDGTFGPEKDITRAETAMIFYRLLNDQNAGAVGSFSDVENSAWYADAVEKLAGLGIITGYADGTFRPGAAITRAEFTAIASRFAVLKTGSVSYSDVPADHWAYSSIASAAAQGWISGFADGTFHPDDAITRAQVTKIVNKMLERTADRTFVDGNAVKTFTDTAKGHWAYYDIEEAANAHDYTKSGSGETWSAVK